MRVIAGSLKGRQFQSPPGHHTHPMSEKMRGALFNMLGDIEGLTVLDAFAGTGALGFEAISRGAAKVVAVDDDRGAQKAIASNIVELGLDNVELISGNVGSWANKNRNQMFNIILADPPYDKPNEALLERLVYNLHRDGIMALSWPEAYEMPRLKGLDQLQVKTYGNARLIFYTRKSAPVTVQ
jgi:16S rRNA (guanine966-N2)-methyltransferase